MQVMRINEKIEQAVALLKKSQRPVSFSGAGLSAESGIATFRDPDEDGLWDQYDPMKMASPDGFEADPVLVINWYNWRRRKLARVKPNPGHFALALDSRFNHITQNVDHLLECAGVDENKIEHLHGTITKDRCNHPECDHIETIDINHPPELHLCPLCNHTMRPAVVWFGESLPPAVWVAAESHCYTTDCLLVVGTSATVYPAAGLIQLAKSMGAKVIVVNKDHNEASSMADIEIMGSAAELLPQLLMANL